MMTTQTVLILGANGRFGRVVAQAFAAAGWRVIAQARKPLLDAGHEELRADVTQATAICNAARGAAVVVNAMNPLYAEWDTLARPLNDAAIAIARGLGATLMFPGNVYNYGSPIPREINEETPPRPTNPKGELRCRMEAAMRQPGIKSIVVRAGDFFGGPGAGSWMDQAIVKDLARGRITYPGPRNLEHAWAYLPDLARTFVLLAAARGRLADHESFHFPGHTLSGDELVQAIAEAARRRGLLAADRAPTVRGMPWPLIRMAGLFVPMLRELARMSYLWREPHRLASRRLSEAVGRVPATPIVEALEATLGEPGFAGGHAKPAAMVAA
jgi:nucleoside-diphosphate-sugar epimerase